MIMIIMIIMMIIMMIFHVTSLSTTSPYFQRVRCLVEPSNQCIFTWTLLEENRKYTTINHAHGIGAVCTTTYINPRRYSRYLLFEVLQKRGEKERQREQIVDFQPSCLVIAATLALSGVNEL